MPEVFRLEAAGSLKAVIGFDVSGSENFKAYLHIRNGTCVLEDRLSGEPDLMILTPSEVWLAIARKELSGQVPRAQWLAWQVMREIRSLTSARQDEFGPDAKVLTQTTGDGHSWILGRLVVSMQHSPEIDWSENAGVVYSALDNLKERFSETRVNCSIDCDAIDLIVNGHGDFSTGGPMGDNGLSGKKLVMDAYGPMVPIGGGAYSGKDPHKVDRAGAVLAREMALYSVINGDSPWDIVQLTWAPGRPDYISLNSIMGAEGLRNIFPDTIEKCVDRYFQKPDCEALPQLAVEGWYSGFYNVSWEGLCKDPAA